MDNDIIDMEEDDEDDDEDEDDEEVELADLDDETSLESSSASGLKNDDSGGWVRAAPRHVSSSLRSHYHQRHKIVEPTSSSPSVSYRGSSFRIKDSKKESKKDKEKDKEKEKKGKKSISSSLRSRFSSSSRRNSDREVRSIANGLKLAQTQAIAVAGFLADVDANQWKVCDTCFSHRASYHGRGELIM